MKHALPPLDRLKVFEAAARHLSFSSAADELCLSKGAVSYQIRKLEQDLGCNLFRREVRQVLLTDPGQLLQQQTRRWFDELSDTLSTLAEQHRSDVVIAATTYVTARWLSNRLASFSTAHPDVGLSFRHNVNSQGFSLRECDIALRWGPCDGQLDRNRVCELPMALKAAASPALLKKYGWTEGHVITAKEFQRGPWRDALLLAEDRTQDLWHLWAGRDLPHTRRVIADANVRVQAAIDGHGWILADDLMLPELEAGLLRTPVSCVLTGYGYQLLRSTSRQNSAADTLLQRLLA